MNRNESITSIAKGIQLIDKYLFSSALLVQHKFKEPFYSSRTQTHMSMHTAKHTLVKFLLKKYRKCSMYKIFQNKKKNLKKHWNVIKKKINFLSTCTFSIYRTIFLNKKKIFLKQKTQLHTSISFKILFSKGFWLFFLLQPWFLFSFM